MYIGSSSLLNPIIWRLCQMNHLRLYFNSFYQHRTNKFQLYALSSNTQLYLYHWLLFNVLRSHTFMDPRFDPTTTWSSDCTKVKAVIEETFDVFEFKTLTGLGVTVLKRSRLLSSSPAAKFVCNLSANLAHSIFLPIVW